MIAIMNPPYDKNLHLKVLNETIKHCDNMVSLQPIRWLQDPLASYKKHSDFNKFKEVRTRIADITIVDREKINDCFNIQIFSDVGVYKITKNGGFDTDNYWEKSRTPFEVRMIKRLMKMTDSLAEHVESNKLDGVRVPLTSMCGNRGNRPIYKDLDYVIEGKKDGKDWTLCKNMGGYEKPLGCALPLSVKFDKVEYAKNFYNSYKTKMLTWVCNITHMQQNMMLNLLPWLDYSKQWTDEELYDYFNLTDDEIKIIEETIK